MICSPDSLRSLYSAQNAFTFMLSTSIAIMELTSIAFMKLNKLWHTILIIMCQTPRVIIAAEYLPASITLSASGYTF